MIYTVKPGDSLSKIADRYTIGGIDYTPALANLNSIANPDLILIGQKIEIPDTWLKPEYQTGTVPAIAGTTQTGTGTAFPSTTTSTFPTQPSGLKIFGLQPTTLIILGIGIIGLALFMGGKKGYS